MKAFAKLTGAGAALFAVLQLVRPGIPVRPATAELQAPTAVRQILEKDCYSCHSDQRRLSWFDQIVPAYWLAQHDILTAREHLDFSTLGSRPAAAQRATLYEAVNMMQLGAMPLPQFVKLHPEAKVTPEDLATLKAYLAPWANAQSEAVLLPGAGVMKTAAALAETPHQGQSSLALGNIEPEWNGLSFDASFEAWKPISTTDRGDNNTFRLILGNETAINAARSGQVSPWPDRTRFAKIAWQQKTGSDGLVHPGNFIQVELMVKDAQLYRTTDGWGWGRWRGLELKPYGSDAHFVKECTGCHLPVRGNDFVYTLPISSAKIVGNEVLNNRAAELPTDLPFQPLDWSAITVYVDPAAHSTATLYGNTTAMQALPAHGDDPANGRQVPQYQAGSVLALVTWEQRDDPHWFGARIPATPRSVEFVQVATPGQASNYRRFAGARLTEDYPVAGAAAQRASFMLHLAPVYLP